MRFSTSIEYATHGLVCLAKVPMGRAVLISDIAEPTCVKSSSNSPGAVFSPPKGGPGVASAWRGTQGRSVCKMWWRPSMDHFRCTPA